MRRKVIEHVQKHFGLSQRKTGKFLKHSTVYWKQIKILELMKSVIAKYPKAGCQMIYLVLRKTDLKINHKRVERVYSKHKLQLKHRKTKKKFIVEKRGTLS